MRPQKYTFIVVFSLILCQLNFPAFSQLGVPITIEKPKEYEERVLRSERSDEKKFTVPRRFIQNTVTHYNYFFNANNKLNEVLSRAKSSFKDDYSRLIPFYNYTLDATITDSIQLDSIIYKASSGIALHDLRNDWADNLYLLWGAAFYLQKKFDSAYLMFQFMNYAFAPKEKDGYYITIGSSRDGNSALSIATKEKNSLPRKVFSEPPSRNDAFIWQIRNFLAQDEFAEAASLIVTLRDDPVFPKRLHNDLHEVQALWFYKQKMWDSAAVHLEQALSNATNQQEKARWEYLTAQLYEMAEMYPEAEGYYSKVFTHTTDLVLDIYARLAAIRVNKDDGEKSAEKNIATLLRMAKRDKYEEYRDIIYYMAAQMQLGTGNIDGTLALLLKSTQYPSNDPAQRNKAFLQLAELSFAKGQYRQAYNFYDSLNMSDTSLKDPEALTTKKIMLGELATNLEIVERQDSLQRIAAMPEDERREFVKKLSRQLRKQQGLKDEGGSSVISPINNNAPPTNLFNTGNQKGEWYFYNASSRSRGKNDFAARWGKRPNADNWRRSAALSAAIPVTDRGNNNNKAGGKNPEEQNTEITFDGLYDNLPLTPEQLKESNDSIQNALFEIGKIYIQKIENCQSGTEVLESLRNRFPGFSNMEEVLFNLYYCYNKNGETAKAELMKKLMKARFGDSDYNTIMQTGKDPAVTAKEKATILYEEVYDLFVEGSFKEALEKKKYADSLYGKNFWTPQLLYIEAVYYIKQRDDNRAKLVLNSIIKQFPDSPLKPRAETMLDVLGRRKQIEEELSKMVVTKEGEDTTVTQPVTVVPPPVVVTQPKTTDSTKTNQPPVVTNPKPVAPDTTTTKPVQPVVKTSTYNYNPDASHYVVLILNKVDPVFSNEAKNAFFRYNRETYYNKTFTLTLYQLDDDNRLLLTSSFKNVQEAIDYIEKAKPKTATEIIPWLKGGKYSYSVISEANLELLKTEKNMGDYTQFLEQHLPGKF